MPRYQIGQFSFPKKGDVADLLKSVLTELQPGTKVTDPFVSDLLTALAREHIEANHKVGAGIEYWVVGSNKDLGYVSKGFRAKQHGRDELVLFSYTDVLQPPRRRAQVAEALTQEALDITRRFRSEAFANGPVKCAITGREIPDKTMADVVHMAPREANCTRHFSSPKG